MEKFNFDEVIDRRGTMACKLDAMRSLFGRDDLTPLWVADMDFAVCPAITAALQQRVQHPIYSYTVAPDSYWQSIIDWQREQNGFCFSREELTYAPGIVRGIAYAVNYFTERGDGIVSQEPVYHPFKHVIVSNHRRALVNDLIPCDDTIYEMDFAGLEAIFKAERPKMLVLCNPHNPGGVIWRRETLQQLAHLCHQYGVLVLSDEIHGDLTMFGNRHNVFAMVSDEAAEISVTFGAPSKTFNIAGVVSSWIVVKNPQLREGFYNWLSSNEFNEPMLFAAVATEAAYTGGREWLTQVKAYLEGNIDWVIDFCARNIPAVKAIRPQAGYLVWLDCSGLGLEQKALVDLFLAAGLALNDGTMFGRGGEAHMRLNVASPRQILEQAFKSLKAQIECLNR